MRWLPWALCLAIGCGAAGPRLEVWTRERVELAQQLEAPSYAPDLWSAAQAAAERARGAAGDAAADARSEARLWLEAAIVEAERVKLAQQRLAVEREIEGMLASAVKAGRKRRALQEAAQRDDYQVFFPKPVYCTDNAAMIAGAGLTAFGQSAGAAWMTTALNVVLDTNGDSLDIDIDGDALTDFSFSFSSSSTACHVLFAHGVCLLLGFYINSKSTQKVGNFAQL